MLRRLVPAARERCAHELGFEALADRAPDIMIRFDRQLRHLYVNPAVTTSTGYPPEHYLGRTNRELGVDPELCALWEREFEALFQDGRPRRFEFALDGPLGRRYFEAHAVPERRSDGSFDTIVSFTRDRTEARRAELARQASDERYHELFELAMDMIFVYDAEGRCTDANAAALAALGYPRDELVGMSYEQIVAPDCLVAARARMSVDVGGAGVFETAVLRKDGGRIPIEATMQPICREGATEARIVIARDRTARQAAQAALAESEALFRGAFDDAPIGMILVDPGGTLVRANAAFARMLDYAPEELTGRTILELTHPDDLLATAENIRYLHERRVERYVAEKRYLRRDGQGVWAHIGVSPVRAPDGSISYFVTQVEDVTERRRLEEALRESQKLEAIGRLAGGVAHDFNNLLLAIHGYGELALGRLHRGDARATEDVLQMLAAADRAADLTRQLLAFGRRQVLNVEVLDLRVVVRGMAQLLRPLIGEQVELAIDAPDEPVRVTADRAQLEQVLANLAVNARDAMPHGGRLSIEVSATATDARLTVSDTGQGMDAATVDRIFEPFFTTKGTAGTGLGLATVHGVVTQSGGRIEVESRPGEGTSFTITLPLSERPLTPAALLTPAAPDGAETVLLVEDEPGVRDVVAEMLTERGYAVVAAADGQEALHVAADAERTVDLVLSDLVMRGLTGRETADRIRTLHPEAKVLYMSGYTDDSAIVAGGLQPGTGFIQKPFSGDDLARRVRELLDA
jgi:PAS domain S-box-containing protein